MAEIRMIQVDKCVPLHLRILKGTTLLLWFAVVGFLGYVLNLRIAVCLVLALGIAYLYMRGYDALVEREDKQIMHMVEALFKDLDNEDEIDE